jgi:N-acetyl-alpha-D-muramate 1-phosphate uridylyltransferase
MKAMILAAGLGTRMRPLTDNIPKPMLRVAGKPLIEHHVRNCVAAGITEIVINHAYLGEQIEAYLGDGKRFGCSIEYSREGEPLESGGGIFRALPLLCGNGRLDSEFGEKPFIAMNADVWTDYPLKKLHDISLQKTSAHAHLVMTDNPLQHPSGDFYLRDGLLSEAGEGKKLTWTGLRVINPILFAGCSDGMFSIVPLLKQAMAKGLVSGEYYGGRWFDIGTPERLQQINELLR